MTIFCNKSSEILQAMTGIACIFLLNTDSVSATTLTPSQVDALINETRALRKEVVQLKRELKQHTQTHKATIPLKSKTLPKLKVAKPQQPVKAAPVPQATSKVTSPKSDTTTPAPRKPFGIGGFPIVLAPDLGTKPAYDGSDLLTNMAQQNGDLLSLQYRQEIENNVADSDPKASDFYLVFSGSLGSQIYNTKGYTGPSTSDVDLVTANITSLAAMGKWVTGFLSLDYDNAPPANFFPAQVGPREANSRLYLDQGYITLGNLNTSNWYASIGQMYVPFGSFSGFMINSPITSSLFSMVERPALIGYSNSDDTTEFDVEAFAYQGETTTQFDGASINEWGMSASYQVTEDKWNGSIGLGYISNIADAEGFQLNGPNALSCNLFGGFAFSCNRGNLLNHRVPGFDVYANYTLNAYSFVAEYIAATEAFSPNDLTFNNKGAKPQSFDIEAAYAFSVFNKPSSIAIGYTITKESLALLVPAKELSLSLNTSLWRNTIESLGFQHDINYGQYDTATGQNLPVITTANRWNLGKVSNTLIFAVSASF